MKLKFTYLTWFAIAFAAFANGTYSSLQVEGHSWSDFVWFYSLELLAAVLIVGNMYVYAQARRQFIATLSLGILSRVLIMVSIIFLYVEKAGQDGHFWQSPHFWQHECYAFIVGAVEFVASILSNSAEVQLRELLESAKAEMRNTETQNADLRNRISILENRIDDGNAQYQIAETHLRNAAKMLGISVKELLKRARAMTPEMALPEPEKMADSAEKNGGQSPQSIVIHNVMQVSASAITENESAITEIRIAEPKSESANANPQNAEPEIRIAEPQNESAFAEPQNTNPQIAEPQWLPNPRLGMEAFQARETVQTVKRTTTTSTEETITSVAYNQIRMALTEDHIAILREAGFSKALPGAVLTNKQLRDFAYTCKTKDNLAAYQEIMTICKNRKLWLMPS